MRRRRLLIVALSMAAVASATVAAARQASRTPAPEPMACEVGEIVEGVTADGVRYGLGAVSCDPQVPEAPSG